MTELISKDYKSYEDTTLSEFESYSNPDFIIDDATFFIAIQRRNQIDCFHGKFRNTDGFISIITEQYEKEKFYVTAIKNLLKQKRYLNLVYEFSHELISSEEFNNELEVNESNYLIEANQKLDNLNVVSALSKVLVKLKEDLNEEDLSEIFSVEDPASFKVLRSFYNFKSFLKGSDK